VEDVACSRQRGEAVQVAPRADDDRGIVPDDERQGPSARGWGLGHHTVHHARQGICGGAMGRKHAEAPGRRPQVLEQVEIEEDRPDAEPLQLLRGRDVLAGAVEHDEIRPACGYRFDVGGHAVADIRHGERLGWVVAPGRAAHEPVTRADREEQFGERWKQRDDPLRRRSERHPPTRVVGDGDAALGRGALFPRAGRYSQRDQAREVGAMCPAAHSKKPTPDGSGDGLASAPGAQRHHPSREGSTGGANGEVSWLRALGSPSRWCPSGDEPRAQRAAPLHARYSGGAAPDSHRLP